MLWSLNKFAFRSMPWEKQFVVDEALAKAEHVFWRQGYDATSMEHLLQCMGIQKGSFYATFGSKHEILMAALELYIKDRRAFAEELLAEPSGLAALKRHLDGVSTESCGEGRVSGCFIVNVALELAPRDAAVRDLVQKALAGQEALYAALLEKAKRAGEISGELDATATAKTLLSIVLGLRVLARAGISEETIRSIRAQAAELLS
jgi:TetR/AcrR family transcriptional repressor of nem operon